MTHTHLIGIGGTGLSAIARVLLERGEVVSGSDRQSSPQSESIQAAGAKVTIGHAAENAAGADLVLRSSAVPDDNVEVQAAMDLNIPVLKRIDYFRDFLSNHNTIAIAGSHGKTTTSAMVAWLLTDLNIAPGFIVGGEVENLGKNATAGNSKYFVIEADEYDYMFWGLSPEIAVVTNIEHDHPDCFPTKESYTAAFEGFADRITKSGVLILCIDDPGANNLLNYAKEKGIQVLSYSIENEQADYYVNNYSPIPGAGYTFDANMGNQKLITVSLQVPGKHNILNALAVLIISDIMGLELNSVAVSLSKFIGAGRRFDILGDASSILIIDDYGHHPTEIKSTLSAAKARYPDRRIWAVWQPHTFSRTLELLEAFGNSFVDADQVVITKVYAAREEAPATYSPEKLISAIDHENVFYADTHPLATNYLTQNTSPEDVVIVFSAGDATEISAQLLDNLQLGEQINE
ncbi:MAG: UDP-N-acetylmuramate--L-alanine ligase [Chloroflexi bacterium]|nr:UDP-N-acetylmuramate--L-alanine ligase [Chloroflexota bacterium]